MVTNVNWSPDERPDSHEAHTRDWHYRIHRKVSRLPMSAVPLCTPAAVSPGSQAQRRGVLGGAIMHVSLLQRLAIDVGTWHSYGDPFASDTGTEL